MVNQLIYVGTYTTPERPESIHVYEFDAANGELRFRHAANDVPNPSFLAISSDHQYLYSVNEQEQFAGVPGGGVSSLRVDAETGRLTPINSQPTHGDAPCYIMLDATERFLTVANYNGGITVLPVSPDGALGAASTVINHQGVGVKQPRQDKPHPHCTVFDPTYTCLLVADLGLDRIHIYKLDTQTGNLIENEPPYAYASNPGAGPRHIVFHPDGSTVYMTNELDSTVAVYAWDGTLGTLTHRQTIPALPDTFKGNNDAADIHIAPSGRFVYSSNRGYDSIAVFEVGAKDHLLTLVEIVPSGGIKPRNFSLDRTGKYLLVANQESGNLVVFAVDAETGRLTRTGNEVALNAPVYVLPVEWGSQV